MKNQRTIPSVAQRRDIVVKWFKENHLLDKWGSEKLHWKFNREEDGPDLLTYETSFYRLGLDEFGTPPATGETKAKVGVALVSYRYDTGEIGVSWYLSPAGEHRIIGQEYLGKVSKYVNFDGDTPFIDGTSLIDGAPSIKPEGYGDWA